MSAKPQPIETQETPLPAAADLREAFEAFNRATASMSSTYEALQKRVQDLDVQLAAANAKLQRNLAEKERVKNCLEAVLGALPVGVMVVDPEGRVRQINAAAATMLGVESESAVGEPLTKTLHQLNTAPVSQRSMQQDFHKGRAVEITVDGDAGESRQIEVVMLAASADQVDAFGGILVFHDVTELKRLEQRSATVSRLTAMGEMAMNVAHEIRNPLGSIELFASALARDLDDRPHQQQLAQYISAGVRSIESIVQNILQFERPRRLIAQPLSAAEVLEESLRYADHLFQQRDIEVVWSLDDGAEIHGDPELLKQVFLNLAINAGQAMDEGGRLEARVAVDRQTETIRVELLDNGPGVPPEMLEKIFDPFVTTRPKGTGLGLTIVHNIVTAHGGAIEIANRPGGGARATVELPLRAAEADSGSEDCDESDAEVAACAAAKEA